MTGASTEKCKIRNTRLLWSTTVTNTYGRKWVYSHFAQMYRKPRCDYMPIRRRPPVYRGDSPILLSPPHPYFFLNNARSDKIWFLSFLNILRDHILEFLNFFRTTPGARPANINKPLFSIIWESTFSILYTLFSG